MATSIKSTRRSIVALVLPHDVPALITFGESVVQRMTGNARFANPVPPLAAVTAALDDLRAAQTAALARTKGAVAARESKRKALVAELQQVRSYVQSVADADEGDGPAIVESAGLSVRKKATRKARVFAAKPGLNAGVATIVAASSARRAAYEWQYSLDGGKTWIAAPPTLQATTTVAGLPSGTSVEFRYRSVTKTGAADWSAPVALTVT